MEVKVLLCVLCLVSANFVNGLSSSETTDVTETCCNHGDLVSVTLDSARSCASAPLPDTVEPEQRETCKAAMISCCEQMFQEKENCNAGLKYSEAKRCGAPQTEIGKTCCEECTFGRWTGESQGEVACVGPSGDEISPTSVFQKTAFYECCLEAARKPEPTTEKVVPTTTPKPVVKRCKQDSCQHNCDDEGGVIRCSCREGYRLQGDKKSCVDINECAEAIDDLCTAEDTVCHNTPGAFKCVPVKKRDVGKGCPAGFKRNVQNQVCDDINECQSPHPPCPKYLCENTIGGYKCGGKPGKPFEETPSTPTEPAPADPMKNEICPPGFRGGEDDECLDIDECEERVDDCQRLSQHCINTHGNFFCQDHVSKRCAPGFQVNTATGICEDIDECEESSEVCKKSEVCVNLPGAYNCKSKISTLPKLAKKTCQEGTRLRPGGRVCEDIDECREGTHLCDQFQNCINTFGAHECRCKNGFELDSSGSCVDIDECAQKLDNCGSGLHCLNVLGSFTCTRQAPSSPRPAAPTTTPPPYYEYEYYDEEDNSTTDAEPLPAAPTTSTSTTTTPRPTPRPTTSPRPTTARPTPTTRRTTTQRPTTTPRPTTTSSTTTAAPRRYNPYTERSTPRNYYTSTTRRPNPPPPPVDPRPDDFYPTPEQPPKPERPDERDNRRPEERPEDRRPSYEPPRPVERDHSRPEEKPEDRRPSYDPSRPNERDNSRPEDRRPSYEQPRPNERENRPNERPEDRRPSYEPPRPNEIEHPSRPYNPRRPSNRRPYSRRTTTPAPTTTEETPALNPEDKYCLNGYEKDAYGNCVDINECESGVHVCGNLESCANRDGGYTCECLAGYRRSPDGWCAPAAAPTTPSTTTEAPTTAVTTPERPYSPYSPLQPSPPAPSHQPVACELGFSYDAGVGRCVDIDECAINKDTCSSLEDCVNIQGGYQCVCGRRCRVENEKPTYVPVQPSAHLPPEYHSVQPSRLPEPGSNVITVGAQFGQRGPWSPRPSYSRLPDTGSIVTSCPWGYKLTSDRRCLDIDECAKNISECGPEQRCENFYGGYSCQCPAGHKLLGQNSCEDIDECTHGNPCAYNARCINSVGSYRCECSEGFRNAPSNDKVCVDVDECADTPGVCQHGCANSWGGYRCYCKRGYRLGTDNKTCVDVNECEEWSSVRIRGKLCGGECVNEPGSYRCACPAGYRLSEDQRSCVDIDECETGEASCARASDPGYVCQNTRGSYYCHHIDCPSGYRLEARHRCTRIQRSCPISDWSCLQQPSTYSYNFITFVANIYLPSGSVDLFTMHGPAWSDSVVSFEMRMMKVEASGGVAPADLRCFDMRPTGNVCVISLLCPLAGPQVAELELTMSLYQRGMFAGSNVARLVVIVSAYEF